MTQPPEDDPSTSPEDLNVEFQDNPNEPLPPGKTLTQLLAEGVPHKGGLAQLAYAEQNAKHHQGGFTEALLKAYELGTSSRIISALQGLARKRKRYLSP